MWAKAAARPLVHLASVILKQVMRARMTANFGAASAVAAYPYFPQLARSGYCEHSAFTRRG